MRVGSNDFFDGESFNCNSRKWLWQSIIDEIIISLCEQSKSSHFGTDFLNNRMSICYRLLVHYMVLSEENMSINSINHDEMTNITNKWDADEQISLKPEKQVKSAEARRRIEALREIRESGLSLEEARELGLIH